MGVNCRISLPTARLRDVANAIGILAGLPAKESPIDGSKALFIEVEGIKTKSCGESLAGCAYINLSGEMVDGEMAHYVMYHFEFDMYTAAENINECSRGMIPPSTPFWCAIGRRLVETFGGTFQASDCGDSEKPDLVVGNHYLNGATNGLEWDAQQRRILELRPVTKADMARGNGGAAYK